MVIWCNLSIIMAVVGWIWLWYLMGYVLFIGYMTNNRTSQVYLKIVGIFPSINTWYFMIIAPDINHYFHTVSDNESWYFILETQPQNSDVFHPDPVSITIFTQNNFKWGVSWVIGLPPVIIQILVGFSLTKTNHNLGYPHDELETPKNIPRNQRSQFTPLWWTASLNFI